LQRSGGRRAGGWLRGEACETTKRRGAWSVERDGTPRARGVIGDGSDLAILQESMSEVERSRVEDRMVGGGELPEAALSNAAAAGLMRSVHSLC
jgi:hypothetical protein